MKAKLIIGFTALVIFTGFVGTSDINTYNGIHSVTGTAINGKVIADNGNTYSASNFSKGRVKVTLDKNGNVIEISSEN